MMLDKAAEWMEGQMAPLGCNGSVLVRLDRLLPAPSRLLGLVHLDHSHPDEILRVDGWSDQAVGQWCRLGLSGDPLLRQSGQERRSIARSASSDPGGLLSSGHVLCATIPESLENDQWWVLRLGRDDRAFSDRDRELAMLLLRQWQAQLNQLPESVRGRLLLGHDMRPIHIDPFTLLYLWRQNGLFDQLVRSLKQVSEQRWPDMKPGEAHDFIEQLGDEKVWVCFRLQQPIDQAEAVQWHIELRPPAQKDIPALGMLDDERIGRALGYIHDRFADSPSLQQISRAVSVSPFHFHRMFTRRVGLSPKQYLQRKQLQVAKWLLLTTRVPIGRIARSAGFSSHGHFTSTFHRLTGQSPSEYREDDPRAAHAA
jgi:AraC-like DNA-binding protein